MRHSSKTPFQAPSFARAPAPSARYSPPLPAKPSGNPPPGASSKQRLGHPSPRRGRALHMPPRAIACQARRSRSTHAVIRRLSPPPAPKLHLGRAGRSAADNTPSHHSTISASRSVPATRKALPARQVGPIKGQPRPRLYSGGVSHRFTLMPVSPPRPGSPFPSACGTPALHLPLAIRPIAGP